MQAGDWPIRHDLPRSSHAEDAPRELFGSVKQQNQHEVSGRLPAPGDASQPPEVTQLVVQSA